MKRLAVDWLASWKRDPCLGRVALILGAGHLLFFVALALAGRAAPLVISLDAGEYLDLAAYPLTHDLYSLDGVQPSAKREPGYSGFIMAFMAAGLVKPHVWTVGNLWPVIVAQIALYGWVCWLIAKQAARTRGDLTALAALLLMQATPMAVYQHMIRNECLTMVLLGLLWIELASRWKKGASWGAVLRSALWFGLLGLTKSLNVLFVPVLGLLAWWRTPVKWPKAAVFVLVSLLPAAAWTARNKAVFGLPIMGSMDGVSSLYRGNILPYFQISSPDHPAMPEEARRVLAACKDDGEKYLWYKAAALEWLKANPVQYVKQCVHRTAAMFIDLYRADDIPWWKYPFRLLIGNDQLFLTILLVVSVVPLWNLRDFWVESSVVFFAFNTAMYGAVYGEERYLYPSLFLLAPVYAWCLVEVWWPRLARRSGTSAGITQASQFAQRDADKARG